MPPRRDTTGDDNQPPLTDLLTQLISATNTAADRNTTQLTALIEATKSLTTKIDAQTATTANLAESFFSYYKIPPEERLALVAFHVTGDALAWYQHLDSNHLLESWDAFKRQVELRFGPSSYENHEATLLKLHQTTTVRAYQTEFEKLSNRVTGLSPQTLKNCFISGLKPEIQSELAILKPTTFHAACGLAQLVEDKLNHHPKPKFPYSPKPFSITPSSNPLTSTPPSASTNKPHPNPEPITLHTPPKPLPFTKLSPEALQQRRKDGLCFRCPEKFVPGHKCSPPQFLIIVDNDEHRPMPDPNDTVPQDETPTPQLWSLSAAAYFGMSSSQTLRITGFINTYPVTVLIDCGSTHNIVQPRIAKHLSLPTNPLEPFRVMVGNGQFIHCSEYCSDVTLQLQKTKFTIPFFVLPIEGADVVLGISWLGALGTITADFSVPQISFVKDGNQCTLRAVPEKNITRTSVMSIIGSQEDSSHPTVAPTVILHHDTGILGSYRAIGAVSSQENKPIAFFSKKLCHTMQGQSTYTKEFYAITEAVKKWRQYLLGRRFRIYMDHQSLKHILTQTIQSPEQQKWVTKLLGYDFEVLYKLGRENTVADALSRVDIPSMLAISYPKAMWLEDIRTYYSTDPQGKEFAASITADPTVFPNHVFRDGLVFIAGKLFIPPISHIREQLLTEFHSSFIGGHAGINATVKRLSGTFTWLRLKKDVAQFVKRCTVFQAIKHPNHKPYGLLQPLPTPSQPWHDISMDFITQLPPSKGKVSIWVIVDRLSKYAHFLPLSPNYTAITLASNVYA
ncbi:ty3-gypsy retrotransposon protein [Tanacetum coccineum]